MSSLSHLRSEQRFSGIDALKAQIASDVLLANCTPDTRKL